MHLSDFAPNLVPAKRGTDAISPSSYQLSALSVPASSFAIVYLTFGFRRSNERRILFGANFVDYNNSANEAAYRHLTAYRRRPTEAAILFKQLRNPVPGCPMLGDAPRDTTTPI